MYSHVQFWVSLGFGQGRRVSGSTVMAMLIVDRCSICWWVSFLAANSVHTASNVSLDASLHQ